MNQYAVVVDFSHLFHLARAAAERAGPQYDLKKTTIENVVGKLRTVKRKLNDLNIVGYDLVFVEDRPPVRKLSIFPGYKVRRSDVLTSAKEEKEDLKQYLLQNGAITRFCWSEGNEADDAIATLVRLALEQPGLFIIVVTADRDLWQLMGPRVRVFNPIKQQMVTEADVQEAFNCQPIHIPLVKALWGDYGDCVPNVVPRMQKYLLPIILKTDGTLDALKTRLHNGEDKYYLSPKCYDLYLSNEPQVEINYQLVCLDDRCELIWE